MPRSETLARIDDACLRVAASTSRSERCGPLLVHHPRRGFPIAARPASRDEVGEGDVRRAVARQHETGLPVRLEWIDDLDPAIRDAALAAGLSVTEHPLLVLADPAAPPTPRGISVRMLDPTDPGFEEARAAVDAGFCERDVLEPERALHRVLDRVVAGALRSCGARDGVGAVGGGTSASADWTIVELTGFAVLPRARRRGIGAAVAHVLAADAVRTGAEVVWMSATDDAVASVYRRAGFRRVGTACVATSAR